MGKEKLCAVSPFQMPSGGNATKKLAFHTHWGKTDKMPKVNDARADFGLLSSSQVYLA